MIDVIGNRTVPGLLDEQVELRAGKTALVMEDREGEVVSYTYAELADHAARTAAGFAEQGIGFGDKVLVHLDNCAEMVFTLLSLAYLGAMSVPSNTACTASEVTHIASWSEAKLAVTATPYLALFEDVLQQVPRIERVIVARGGACPGQIPFETLLDSSPVDVHPDVRSETPVEILFTNGTTALPKGVVATQANWLWAGERISRTLRLDESDRLLTVLPLFHVNAQMATLINAMTLGATAVILEKYSASRFIGQLRRHQATHTSIVATIVRTLLAQPESSSDRDHAVRRVSYGLNIPEEVKDAFESRFGMQLLNGYALTEAMVDVTTAPVTQPKRWPSVGLPGISREVRVVGPDGVELPIGEVGEITVRGVPGRTIMLEYYNDPAATAKTIVDGWLYTGDNGYVDELGYLYFVGRTKDVIKRAGENISAVEVEEVIAHLPEVDLVAVIGVADALREEAVKAFVVCHPGASLTEEQIREHCATRLAHFKVPTIIEFRERLPMTSIGKVAKRELREVEARGDALQGAPVTVKERAAHAPAPDARDAVSR